MIAYDNSMYTTNPPSIIAEPIFPIDIENEAIRNHIDEENYDNGFIDMEEIRNRELNIKGEIVWVK